LRLAFRLACVLILITSGGASAHDPSTYGGVFRSRNLGGTWLNADVGIFLNAALTVAIDPRDPAHLLAGTDLGILRSRNGGRSWVSEAPDVIFGAVFAAAFLPEGDMCAAASGVFRRAGDRWAAVRAPDAAVPARVIAAGASGRQVYLLGPHSLFASQDGGRSFAGVPGLAETRRMTALVVIPAPQELLVAVVDGRIMTSQDGGHQWRDGGVGEESEPVTTVALDPHATSRIWAAIANRLVMSDDIGSEPRPVWRPVGRALPEPGTKIRGIAAEADAATLLVTTDRGTYRSENGGDSWTLKEDNLPIHLEAGPLARDPEDARIVYAVYSLMPYSEVWRAANDGGNLMARLDPISLAGGTAFCLLVLIGGGLSARWLAHRRLAGHRTSRAPQ
jgi:hypothetical protein